MKQHWCAKSKVWTHGSAAECSLQCVVTIKKRKRINGADAVPGKKRKT